MKLQDTKRLLENFELDVTAHQKCIATLEEELLAKNTEIGELQSKASLTAHEMSEILSELTNRNNEVQILKSELAQYVVQSQSRLVADDSLSRTSDSADSVVVMANSFVPMKPCTDLRESVKDNQSLFYNAIGPTPSYREYCDSTGGLSAAPAYNLAKELGENHFYDDNSEAEDIGTENGGYSADDLMPAAYGNGVRESPIVIHSTCEEATRRYSASSDTFNAVNGQEVFPDCQQTESGMQDTTDDLNATRLHLTYAPADQNIYVVDAAESGAMITHAMKDDKEMNAQ